MDYNNALMEFIAQHPTNFHVVAGQVSQLEAAGYIRLGEAEEWNLEPGGKYFVTRNGSALVAFRAPKDVRGEGDGENLRPSGFMIMASHSDSPTFRIKENPEVRTKEGYTTLNVELYGGALLHPWFDRPLSVAGRIMVRTAEGVRTLLIDIKRPLLMIPSLAIHMDREVNKGRELNVQKDMLPLFGGNAECDLLSLVAQEAQVEKDSILAHELTLHVCDEPTLWGASEEYLSAPRLDDVQCAFSSLAGFLESEDSQPLRASCAIPVHAVLDNEEVGSGTKQGAASTFLKDVLKRASTALSVDAAGHKRMIANSLMLSADNAHGLHPNYPEKCDPTNRPVLNGGVVLKHAANQRYTTDAVSAALVRLLAQRAEIPLQDFVNRSDTPGGSTLGNISASQVPVNTADVGIAQLAMHSCYETCGAADTARMIALARALFSSAVIETAPGEYRLL